MNSSPCPACEWVTSRTHWGITWSGMLMILPNCSAGLSVKPN